MKWFLVEVEVFGICYFISDMCVYFLCDFVVVLELYLIFVYIYWGEFFCIGRYVVKKLVILWNKNKLLIFIEIN